MNQQSQSSPLLPKHRTGTARSNTPLTTRDDIVKERAVYDWATVAVILALGALSVVFLWQVIILGRVLVPVDILYELDPLWRSLAPIGFHSANNLLDYDKVTMYYPEVSLGVQALHQGIVPLWNPYSFAGTPFLAAMQPAALDPINLLVEWFAPATDVLGWRAMIDVAITLIGTFLYARSLQRSRCGAAITALAFGLGTPAVVWIATPVEATFAWLPWVLLGIEQLIRTRGAARWLVVTSTALGLMILAGHSQSAAHALLLCGSYAVFRLVESWRTSRDIVRSVRLMAILLGAAMLGVAVTAAQLLPALVQLNLSEVVVTRGSLSVSSSASVLGNPIYWIPLVLSVIPDFFGSPTLHELLLPVLALNYNETALYVGAIPLLLAGLSLTRRRDPYVLFFAGAAIVSLGMAAHLPVLGLLDRLPVLRLASDERLRIDYAFAMAVLAGFGLDALHGYGLGRLVWRALRLWWLVVAALAATAVALLHTFPNGIALLEIYPPLGRVALHLVRPDLSPNDPRLRQLAAGQPLSLQAALPAAAPALWLTLFIGIVWLYRRGIISMVSLQRAAVLLVALDLCIHGIGYQTTTPRSQVQAIPPAVRLLQGDHSLFRVAPLGSALLASTSGLYGLQDIRGYEPTYSADYGNYYAISFIPPSTDARRAQADYHPQLSVAEPSTTAAHALDLLNVKYILAACSPRLDTRVYPLIYSGSGCVYRNPTALPRALLVHHVEWATSARAEQLLGRGAVDPRSTVLLDSTTVNPSDWKVSSVPHDTIAADTVRVASYGLNRVDLMVRSAARGVVVLSDAYAPGWQAQVDGAMMPLARANGVFRAVAVGPGLHKVQFTYRPQSFTIGVFISVSALAILVVLVLLAAWNAALAARARLRSSV